MRKSQKQTKPEHKCDDCAFGKWQTQHWNRDIEGRPITLRCPHYKDGQEGIIRGTAACRKFAERNQ
ncbi:MAG: hypothetical protein IJ640_00265 [Prevotella sp.]|nr:hypothetical protein [Prevotella sp.]